MPSEESVERLLAYKYNEVEGTEKFLQVKKMPVQFSVVDIFDLLEEHLGEAEDLEAAFPRAGVRARVVASENPQAGELTPNLPTSRARGPPLIQSTPRGVPRSPRGGRARSGQWQAPDSGFPLLSSVTGVAGMATGIGTALTRRVSGLQVRVKAKARATSAHGARALRGEGSVSTPTARGPSPRPCRAAPHLGGGASSSSNAQH